MIQNPTILREANRACEQLRAKTRHAEVLEAQLKTLMAKLGMTSAAVDITDPLLPLGGTSLQTDGYEPRAVIAPRARTALAREGEAFWPRPAVGRCPLLPATGFAHARADTSHLRTIGFLMLGFDRNRLEKALETIDEAQEGSKQFVPLLIYDGQDFDLFRSRGWVLEWIPPQEDQARTPGTAPWERYLEDRLALLKQKWGMLDLVRIDPAMVDAGTEEQKGDNRTEEADGVAVITQTPAEPARAGAESLEVIDTVVCVAVDAPAPADGTETSEQPAAAAASPGTLDVDPPEGGKATPTRRRRSGTKKPVPGTGRHDGRQARTHASAEAIDVDTRIDTVAKPDRDDDVETDKTVLAA